MCSSIIRTQQSSLIASLCRIYPYFVNFVPAEDFYAEKTILYYPNYKNARDGQTKKKQIWSVSADLAIPI